MKNRIITLCLLLVVFSGMNVSYAAFPVKHAETTENAPAPAAKAATTDTNYNAESEATTATVMKAKHLNFFRKVWQAIYPAVEVVGGGPAWPGILALIFGIAAFSAFLALPFLLFSIGAVIFGAVGVGHGYSFRLLALIGLILGILALTALLL